MIDPSTMTSTPSGYATAEQLQAMRDYGKYLQQGAGQQPVKHWTQGVSNMANALVGGLQQRWANEAQATMMDKRGLDKLNTPSDAVNTTGLPASSAVPPQSTAPAPSIVQRPLAVPTTAIPMNQPTLQPIAPINYPNVRFSGLNRTAMSSIFSAPYFQSTVRDPSGYMR